MPGFDDEIDELRSRRLLRRLRIVGTGQGTEIEIAGRRLLNFSSNDYLGLAASPLLREAAKAAVDQYGAGSGSSRLICGTLAPHAQLEEALARFKGTEAALAFSSGYATAVGTLSALARDGDVLILDKLCHASLIDGAKLSGATIRVFPHNHLGKLESHLEWARQNHPDGRHIVVTEGIFSMDGDRAPLAEIAAVKKRFNALLLVDEAHAVGVLGRNGRGLADALRLEGEVDIQMGTLSKALGGAGGYIAGSRKLIEVLINRARSFIYSTAPPPSLAAAATAAIEWLLTAEGERRREALWQNLAHFGEMLPALFADGRKIQSPILPIVLGETARALEVAEELYERGIFVPAIRYPTVPKDAARLRVTITAAHTPEQITTLASALHASL
jgi:8-amino-7-oxononanoate synthase